MSGWFEVVDPGVASTVQDHGRPGLAHLGIPASGAVDRRLAALVNRLAGNAEDAAVVETCGSLTIRAGTPLLVATSSELAPLSLAPGEVLRVTPDERRLWHYVAISGGIDVPPVLGSRAADTLSGLGTPPLRPADRLPVGAGPPGAIAIDQAPLAELDDVARVSVGPRAEWFEPTAYGVLTSAEWTVTASSRVGVRLAGPRLERRVTAELPSEGLVRGAIQIPPDGHPVMMLADHPTTGGYPVLAVVHPEDVALVAQHRPGSVLRFRG